MWDRLLMSAVSTAYVWLIVVTIKRMIKKKDAK